MKLSTVTNLSRVSTEDGKENDRSIEYNILVEKVLDRI